MSLWNRDPNLLTHDIRRLHWARNDQVGRKEAEREKEREREREGKGGKEILITVLCDRVNHAWLVVQECQLSVC